MKIDFSEYTLEDLHSSARSIDREAFPENAQRIDDLISVKQREYDEVKAQENLDPFLKLAPVTKHETKLAFCHTKFYLRTVLYLSCFVGVLFGYRANPDLFHSNLELMFTGIGAMALGAYCAWELALFICGKRHDFICLSEKGFSYQNCNKLNVHNWHEISAVEIVTTVTSVNFSKIKVDYLYIQFSARNEDSITSKTHIRFIIKQYNINKLNLAYLIHHYAGDHVQINADL